MRIIRGEHKGKHFYPPKYFKDRPTTDFAKEGLFNILENNFYFDQISVLDLFAGTGSISYEFASRGCKYITAVEKNSKYAKFIEQVTDSLLFDISVITCDVFEFIQRDLSPYDIIFCDPPFNFEELNDFPDELFQQKLKNEALIIIEHSKKMDFSKHQYLIKTKKYGQVHFSFFKQKSE